MPVGSIEEEEAIEPLVDSEETVATLWLVDRTGVAGADELMACATAVAVAVLEAEAASALLDSCVPV